MLLSPKNGSLFLLVSTICFYFSLQVVGFFLLNWAILNEEHGPHAFIYCTKTSQKVGKILTQNFSPPPILLSAYFQYANFRSRGKMIIFSLWSFHKYCKRLGIMVIWRVWQDLNCWIARSTTEISWDTEGIFQMVRGSPVIQLGGLSVLTSVRQVARGDWAVGRGLLMCASHAPNKPSAWAGWRTNWTCVCNAYAWRCPSFGEYHTAT